MPVVQWIERQSQQLSSSTVSVTRATALRCVECSLPCQSCARGSRNGAAVAGACRARAAAPRRRVLSPSRARGRPRAFWRESARDLTNFLPLSPESDRTAPEPTTRSHGPPLRRDRDRRGARGRGARRGEDRLLACRADQRARAGGGLQAGESPTERHARSVQALDPRAPRRARTSPQPTGALIRSCPMQCAPPAPTHSRHL